jgi:hypothetical protein
MLGHASGNALVNRLWVVHLRTCGCLYILLMSGLSPRQHAGEWTVAGNATSIDTGCHSFNNYVIFKRQLYIACL